MVLTGNVIPGQFVFHYHWTGDRDYSDRGYFFLSCTGIDNNSSNSYLQRGKLFVAISGISYYLTLLEEKLSDKRNHDFLKSCSYIGILS